MRRLGGRDARQQLRQRRRSGQQLAHQTRRGVLLGGLQVREACRGAGRQPGSPPAWPRRRGGVRRLPAERSGASVAAARCARCWRQQRAQHRHQPGAAVSARIAASYRAIISCSAEIAARSSDHVGGWLRRRGEYPEALAAGDEHRQRCRRHEHDSPRRDLPPLRLHQYARPFSRVVFQHFTPTPKPPAATRTGCGPPRSRIPDRLDRARQQHRRGRGGRDAR